MKIKKFLNYEVVSYIIFGGLTTIIDWVVYTLLRFVGLDYMVSSVISWISAVLFAFVTNKFVVFKSNTLKLEIVAKEFVSFLSARITTGILTIVGMWILVPLLNGRDFIAKAIISVLVVMLNYIFSKLFVFKNRA